MLRINYLYTPYFVKNKKKRRHSFQEEEKAFSKDGVTKECHRLNVCAPPPFTC